MKKNLIILVLFIFISFDLYASTYLGERNIIRIEAVSHPDADGFFIQFDAEVNTGAECVPSVQSDTVFVPHTLNNYNAILSVALAAFSSRKPVRVVTGICGSLQYAGTVIKPTAIFVHGISAVK